MMADLKTDYKDDVLDTSANEKRRYKLIQNDDGTVSLEDVTTYLQTGDSFGAKDINETNKKVNATNNNLTKVNVSVNDEGKLVFTDSTGADTVLNFSPYPETYAIAGYYGTSDDSRYYCYHSNDNGDCVEYYQVKGASTSTIFDDDNVKIEHSIHQFVFTFKKSAVLKIYDSGAQASVEYSAGDTLTVDTVWQKVPMFVYPKTS